MTEAKRFHLPKTLKVEINLQKQKANYLKKYKKKIRKDDLASLLLETATLK